MLRTSKKSHASRRPNKLFFPSEMVSDDEDENLKALLRAARQLHPADLEELRKYAEFRKARSIYQERLDSAGSKRSKHK